MEQLDYIWTQKTGTTVAEYYGFRTDVDSPIAPISIPEKNQSWIDENSIPVCPFSAGNVCKKAKSKNEPVCSVRNKDGDLWIACSERLCATKKDKPLCRHQQDILLDIARHIFSKDLSLDDVCVKREASLAVVDGTSYHADYIMTTRSGRVSSPGPDRVILEMQGGGETTNTGKLTDQVKLWKEMHAPCNEVLRGGTAASPLVTNAWRRQQEQFLVKGNIAMKTWKGLGLVFCVGTLLYDYLKKRLKDANLQDLKDYYWNLALIAIEEDKDNAPSEGPIPLRVDEGRMLFTNYQSFVQALINQGSPSVKAFEGDFITLDNQSVTVPF